MRCFVPSQMVHSLTQSGSNSGRSQLGRAVRSSMIYTTFRIVNNKRPIGRPPGPHDDTLAKILPTAIQLFLNEGGAALTPTRLHKETGVSRATIYRNWPEPADIIEIMLDHATEMPADDRWTGDIRADLCSAADLVLMRMQDDQVRAFFSAGLEYGRYSARLATAGEAFIANILEPFRIVVARSVDAGTTEGEVHALVVELAGPLILEHLVMGRSVPKNRSRVLVDHFLVRHPEHVDDVEPGTDDDP